MAKNLNNCCTSEEQKKILRIKEFLALQPLNCLYSIWVLLQIPLNMAIGAGQAQRRKGIGEKGSRRKTTKQILFEKGHNDLHKIQPAQSKYGWGGAFRVPILVYEAVGNWWLLGRKLSTGMRSLRCYPPSNTLSHRLKRLSGYLNTESKWSWLGWGSGKDVEVELERMGGWTWPKYVTCTYEHWTKYFII